MTARTPPVAPVLLAVAAAASFLPSAATADSPADRPNVLLVLTEDQGAHLGRLGTAGLQTPHIDGLAEEGTFFPNAFVAYPVCSASKASIYTGLFGHTNGILNNTYNFHKPAAEVTAAERAKPLSRNNRVLDRFPTLTEILKEEGYYQGVTHKLHVLPNEKFPYDEFLRGGRGEIDWFLAAAKRADRPWFLLVNIPDSHRPYPSRDKGPISVDPADVELPAYLPDTPEVRLDWAEYLAGVERADELTGAALAAVEASGQAENTVVVFLSDHGPTFPHGKMTLYDLGLRVPLVVRGPGVAAGVTREELASGVDLLPTLLDLCGIERTFETPLHGRSLAPLLTADPADDAGFEPRDYVFAEISNRGPLPNDGIQERTVFDGRWKLILRENVEKGWRQVNADSRQFEVWGNRSYAATVRLKDEFPEAFRVLAEQDPQNLGGAVLPVELYDLKTDPDEMTNVAADPAHADTLRRLRAALVEWSRRTADPATSLAR